MHGGSDLLKWLVIVVGELTFLPALSLGPVTKQLAMRSGHFY
jgi:K+-transporting ATPase A subunit